MEKRPLYYWTEQAFSDIVYPEEMTLPGGYLHPTCPSRGVSQSGRVNVPKRQ